MSIPQKTRPSIWPAVGSLTFTVLTLAALVTLLAEAGPVTRLEVAAIAATLLGAFGWALLSGVAIATWVRRRGRRRIAERIVQERVDAGELVRVPGGGLVEAGWAEARRLHGAQLDPEAKE